MYVSEKQKANLAAGSIQHWWVRSVVERRRQLRTVTAATLVQAAWRGRAARLVAGEKWTKREENRRMSEASCTRIADGFYPHALALQLL